MHITGDVLRGERAAAYLTIRQIAEAMGVHRNTITAIERPRPVSPERVEQYRDAIARLTKAAA